MKWMEEHDGFDRGYSWKELSLFGIFGGQWKDFYIEHFQSFFTVYNRDV